MDMISDIAMIKQFFKEGNDYYAQSILVSVSANLAVQVLTVYANNHRKSVWKIIYEVLVVVTCLKPAIDAARVARGKEQQTDERKK